ncbi:MAG: YceI family protein [Acidobacteriota bacterium]
MLNTSSLGPTRSLEPTRRRPLGLFAIALVLAATPTLAQGHGGASPWTLDPEASVFAVITHKDGVAAKLAHNHLVTAHDVTAELAFDPGAPEASSLRFETPVEALQIDEPSEQARWYPRIAELGLLDEEFSEIDAGKRDKIRGSMLGRKQLDARTHATLSGATGAIKKDSEGLYVVELELTIKGQPASRPISARYRVDGERLVIEGWGRFEFTDFGIKPYSAMLGAVKNANGFHVYLQLEATRASASDP